MPIKRLYLDRNAARKFGVIAHWPFSDPKQSPMDVVAGVLVSSFNGATKYGQSNKAGAMAFSSTASGGFLRAATETKLGVSGKISVSFWSYQSSLNASGAVIVCRGSPVLLDINYEVFFNSSGNLVFQFQAGGSYQSATSTATDSTGKWYHHTIVVDESASTKIRFYRNGILASTPTYPAASLTNTGTREFVIGNLNYNGSPFGIIGRLRDLSIHNIALTAAQVATMYSRDDWLIKARRIPAFASVSGANTVAPSSGAITYTGNAPTISQGTAHAVAPSAGAIVYTGNVPTVTAGVTHTVSPSTGSVTYTGNTPAVSQPRTVAPSSGAVTYTGNTPTVVQTGPQTVAPSSGTIVITGNIPTVSNGAQSPILGGANPWARWVKDRRKIEAELRKARDDELDAVLREIEAEAPAVVAKVRRAAKAPESTRPAGLATAMANDASIIDYDAIRNRYTRQIARAIERVVDAEFKRARDQDNDAALMLLLLAA